MFFTRVGRVVAWLAFAFGALRVGMGLSIALSENSQALAARYLGSKTTGEVIDRGVEMLVFGIALGILTEISRAIAKTPPTLR